MSLGSPEVRCYSRVNPIFVVAHQEYVNIYSTRRPRHHQPYGLCFFVSMYKFPNVSRRWMRVWLRRRRRRGTAAHSHSPSRRTCTSTARSSENAKACSGALLYVTRTRARVVSSSCRRRFVSIVVIKVAYDSSFVGNPQRQDHRQMRRRTPVRFCIRLALQKEGLVVVVVVLLALQELGVNPCPPFLGWFCSPVWSNKPTVHQRGEPSPGCIFFFFC